MLWRALVAWAVTLAVAGAAQAQSSYPMLMGLNPLAVQVGAESEHEISSRYTMYGAYQVLVSGDGVTAEVLAPDDWGKYEQALAALAAPAEEPPQGEKPADAKPAQPPKRPETTKLKLRFTAAADALPGVREVRLATPQGVTTVGQLVVTRDPVMVEKGNNDSLATATPIETPATVCGTIERAEDVDFFKFRATAGQQLVFHCLSARCQDRIHDLQTHVDPIMSLRNAAGVVLALNDNYFFGDPLLAYRFDADGDYYLEIRDVRYQGNVYWHYAVEVTDRPFVTQAFPMSVARGSRTELQVVGFNAPADASSSESIAAGGRNLNAWRGQVSVEVPEDAPLGPGWYYAAADHRALLPLVVTDLAIVPEQFDHDNQQASTAQDLPGLPCAVSGCIESPGDVDCYAFAAKKGDRLTFEVMARRHESALDSNLRVLDEKGKTLAENDDLTIGRRVLADSMVEAWTAPADGRYVLEVRDLHLRGGPEYVYHLAVTRAEPTFRLEADTDKTLLFPGVAGVVYVKAYRKNGFAGEIDLSIEGLPEGVTATCGRILASGGDGAIVLSAGADVAPCVAEVRIFGQAPLGDDAAATALRVEAEPLQETYLPGGGRGHFPVSSHMVSVGATTDIRAVRVEPREIRLRPGESQKIEFTIERAPGFDKNVMLDVMLRHLARPYGDSLPPGVTIDDKASKTLLTGGQNTGHITLKAAADCKPVERQLIAAQAQVAINFVMKMSYAAEPCFITVEAPEASK